jgi:hypothetical protein
MTMQSDDLSLGQELDIAIDRFGSWTGYKEYFLKLDAQRRINELGIFQQKMNAEARPSREWASYLARYREIADLDKLLRSSGR